MTAAPSDTRHADPATSLVAIAHPRDDIEAQLITNLLADAGIEAMVTGAMLAGFRAEAPANVCVVVRGADADAAREALAAARPTIDEADVGDDLSSESEPPQRRIIDTIFPATLLLGALSTLGIFGLWLAGFRSLQASPLDFVIAFGMLGLLWLVWKKRQA